MNKVKTIVKVLSLVSLGFASGYLVRSKRKKKVQGTLFIQEETNNWYTEVYKDVPDIKKMKTITFRVTTIR